jgi:hypothetical protein
LEEQMIIDMQSSVQGVTILDTPIWQLGTPPIDTTQRQGVGGPVEAIATVQGTAGAQAYVIGSSENLSP